MSAAKVKEIQALTGKIEPKTVCQKYAERKPPRRTVRKGVGECSEGRTNTVGLLASHCREILSRPEETCWLNAAKRDLGRNEGEASSGNSCTDSDNQANPQRNACIDNDNQASPQLNDVTFQNRQMPPDLLCGYVWMETQATRL